MELRIDSLIYSYAINRLKKYDGKVTVKLIRNVVQDAYHAITLRLRMEFKDESLTINFDQIVNNICTEYSYSYIVHAE